MTPAQNRFDDAIVLLILGEFYDEFISVLLLSFKMPLFSILGFLRYCLIFSICFMKKALLINFLIKAISSYQFQKFCYYRTNK